MSVLFYSIFLTSNADAATITAAQSGNWSSTSTWTGGVVPDVLDDVQIVVDNTITITIDQDVTINSLKLGAGATYAKRDILILDTDKNLIITGNFTWDKVGIFQQNAGSSVTAANYVFGTSGSGYSMIAWNIYGTAGNRASVHGVGNIVAAAPTLPPVQQIDWQYTDFDITGYISIPLKNAWDANAYSSLNIDHCYFNSTGYIDIGQYANSANALKITNNDFRNITSTLSGFNSNLTIRTSVLSTLGNFSFDGNVFSQPVMGKVYLMSVGNSREVKNNVFNNSSLDLYYIAAVPTAQRSLKVFNNVFYADASAGSVNGQLLDSSGGAEIYDNLFIGIPYNTHTIMFTGSYASDLPKTIIRNNIFDMADGDSDVLNLNYVPVDILNNIFINKGTPVNLGVSGGGGGGDLSPNSGYVNLINNTSYLNDTVAALVWAGETSQHTGGAVTIKNNIIGENRVGISKAYFDSQSTVDAFDHIDNSWFYADTGATLTKYEGIIMTGKIQGDLGFGASDQTGDPLFFDESRLSTAYDLSLSGPGTTDNLVSEMMKKNGNVAGESLVTGYDNTSALSYFRTGFTPTNKSLAVLGENGGYMGAILITSEPTAPNIGTATAGDTQATVTFTAPSSNGGSAITGYTVTSIPSGGVDSNAGETGLSHVVTGLTNGTSYTFTVTATNAIGTSPASSASNAVTPVAPSATSFTFTGPSSGNVNSASTNFTITPNNLYTGTITIAPSGTGSIGLSATVLTFSNSSVSQTFTITPTTVGSITLTPTNNGVLTNPSNLTYTVNAIAPDSPTLVSATAGDTQATVTFTAPSSNGGSAITGYTVTSIPSGGVDSNAGTTGLSHTITGLTNGTSYTFKVTATNAIGTSPASSASNAVTPVAPSLFTLNYTAGLNGTITGSSTQIVVSGSDGSTVTAVADSGYYFTSWSDGVLTSARTDLNIQSDKSVTANFSPLARSRSSGSTVINRYNNLISFNNQIEANKLINQYPNLLINKDIPSKDTKFIFNKNLKFSDSNNDVLELQKYLNSNGYIISKTGAGSIGKETNYFGLLTKKAVIKFQIANGLKGDGVVGPLTRSKFK